MIVCYTAINKLLLKYSYFSVLLHTPIDTLLRTIPEKVCNLNVSISKIEKSTYTEIKDEFLHILKQ